MAQRRSVRDFAADPVPRELIEIAIATASHRALRSQPPTLAIRSGERPPSETQIRVAAEAEERESYEGGRMPDEWLAALAPLGTTWRKPYLETAPWLVVVFEQSYRLWTEAVTSKNYYVKESVGIACGLFIAALHNMGLATLPHTPSPMEFLSQILAPAAKREAVRALSRRLPGRSCARAATRPRKPLDAVSVWFESGTT